MTSSNLWRPNIGFHIGQWWISPRECDFFGATNGGQKIIIHNKSIITYREGCYTIVAIANFEVHMVPPLLTPQGLQWDSCFFGLPKVPSMEGAEEARERWTKASDRFSPVPIVSQMFLSQGKYTVVLFFFWGGGGGGGGRCKMELKSLPWNICHKFLATGLLGKFQWPWKIIQWLMVRWSSDATCLRMPQVLAKSLVAKKLESLWEKPGKTEGTQVRLHWEANRGKLRNTWYC